MRSLTYTGPGENVFLFIPNLIGYARVLLLAAACWYMREDHVKCCIYYILSAFMDALDGHAARHWGQTSMFGAVLDMVTDRIATSLLMVGLAVLYPAHTFGLQMLVGLDIGSHWVHMQASHASGKGSHKSIDLSKNYFLYYYYTSRACLFCVCAANEWLWAMMYLVYFLHKGQEQNAFDAFTTPPPEDCGWAFPITISSFTLSIWQWIGLACIPVSIFKNIVNVIQLICASIDVVNVDATERAKGRTNNSSESIKQTSARNSSSKTRRRRGSRSKSPA